MEIAEKNRNVRSIRPKNAAILPLLMADAGWPNVAQLSNDEQK